MINLTQNIMNKPESQYLNQTSFHYVTLNIASSGLRENVILTNTYHFGAKFMMGNLAPI